MEPATCLGCGCACDDIVVEVRDGRIVEAGNACVLGKSWFGDGSVSSAVLVRGAHASVEEALDAAAGLLGGARRALVYLAPDISCEAQRAAVALADQLHGVVDNIASATIADGILAAQRRGRVTATLGEIRNRADVLVFWGVDPAERYPRFLTRYAPDPEGVFVPGGRRGRTVIAVDVGDDRGPSDADLRIALAPGDEEAAVAELRAAIARRAVAGGAAGAGAPKQAGDEAKAPAAGKDAATSKFATASKSGNGQGQDTLAELTSRLDTARYAVIVYDAEPDEHDHSWRAEALTALTQQLNATIRCSLMVLRGGGNRNGAESVMTWQTGYPMTVDYSRGAPRYRPDEGAASLLERGALDAVLTVGNARSAGIPSAGDIPRIVIGPWASQVEPAAEVAIDTGVAGIHEGGMVFRMDDVPLPLRPALPGPPGTPDLVTLLEALGTRLRARTANAAPERGRR